MAKENNLENEYPKSCPAKRHDGSPCGRPIFDNYRCIFHSDWIRAEKKQKFNEIFWKEFERQKKEDEVYDFSGFVFSQSIEFNNTIFNKNTYFSGAKFLGENNEFLNSKFLGAETDFNEVNFSGKFTDFSFAEFSGEKTYFSATKFVAEVTLFQETIFSGKYTMFSCAKFSGGVQLSDAEFSGEYITFSDTEFLGHIHFSDVKFTVERIDLFNSYFRKVEGFFDVLSYKTKFLKRVKYKIKDFRFKLGEETAINYPLIDRMTKDAWFLADFQRKHPWIYKLWNLTSNCGRSILRWAAWSLGIAVLFALIFMLIGPEAFDLRHKDTGFSFFYYSIVTFTTLGFGDITPKTLTTEILITIEVILGYIMLGGLISIFANKLSRRS